MRDRAVEWRNRPVERTERKADVVSVESPQGVDDGGNDNIRLSLVWSPLGYFGPFPAPIVLLSSDEASGREERGTNDTKAGWTRNERQEMEDGKAGSRKGMW